MLMNCSLFHCFRFTDVLADDDESLFHCFRFTDVLADDDVFHCFRFTDVLADDDVFHCFRFTDVLADDEMDVFEEEMGCDFCVFRGVTVRSKYCKLKCLDFRGLKLSKHFVFQ